MTAERWRRVEELFHSAVELRPAQREKFLRDSCNGDDEIRRRVESLLEGDANPRAILDQGPPIALASELEPGATLGPYRIDSKLGEGGMGVVYRATDTRLGRNVAIKMIQHGIGSDPQAVERFAREARSTSALNHPHICSLYDVGEQSGMHYLVMEFIEGETLAARLKRGALPQEQVLRYGKEIAEALAAAHARGIIHRDLKPDNIALTTTGAKLLDFGLAKLAGPAAPDQKTITATRVIAGTPGYMAPEQAEGRECDARTDIYALGLVLREMATGKRASSHGTAVASSIGPPQLALVIDRCLAHEPEDRWHSAADVRLLLGTPAAVPQRAPAYGGWRWVAAACGVTACVAVAALLAFLWWRSPAPPAAAPVRFTTSLPASTGPSTGNSWSVLALSPDGRRLAIVMYGALGARSLWVRDLQSAAMRRLDKADTPVTVFWSPDSEFICYIADRHGQTQALMKIHHAAGAPQLLAEGYFQGTGAWAADGSLLIGIRGLGIARILPNKDRAPLPLTKLQEGELLHSYPALLPGEDRFLYLALSSDASKNAIYVQGLGEPGRKRLMANATGVALAPGGHILFARADNLFAQRLNPRTLELESSPINLASGIRPNDAYGLAGGTTTGQCMFTASGNGHLAYLESRGQRTSQLVWLDRTGARIGVTGEPGNILKVTLAPDQRNAAVELLLGERREIRLVNLATGASSRLNFGVEGSVIDPIWSPDSKLIAAAANGAQEREIRVIDLSTNKPTLIYSDQDLKLLDNWTPDGRYILYHTRGAAYALPTAGERKPILLQKESYWDQITPSPDGKWIAFNTTSPSEVFVATFPGLSHRRQVSVRRGGQPLWSPGGNELLYIDRQNKLMSVPLKKGGSGATLEPGVPTPMFDVEYASGAFTTYQLSADGKRILTMQTVNSIPAQQIQFILNWPGLVKSQ